jgi:hypothetical protein
VLFTRLFVRGFQTNFFNFEFQVILNAANNTSCAPNPLQPVTDNTNIASVDAKTLISPPAAITPGTHATPSIPTSVAVADLLASPTRPAANRATPLPSPLPPPSAGKQELNDAAMALTWLAEALTAPNAVSPLVPNSNPPAQQHPPATGLTGRRRKATNAATPFAGMQQNNAYTTPYGAGAAGEPLLAPSGSLRGRRAASQRCSTVVQEAILNDRLLNSNPRSLQEGYEPTPRAMNTPATAPQSKKTGSRTSEAALAASAERKLKGYSENSRVGRAMISILEYITIHQPEYYGVTPFGGVPERIVRQEFGNNPDTSKALRFLVSEKKIVRKGAGGRRDPFNYVLSNGAVSLAAAAAAADDIASETAVAIALAAAGSGEGATVASPPSEDKATFAIPNTVAAPATVMGPPSLTPAAAAATLTAPSTGKWPATEARTVAADPSMRGRKPSQPRLSLAAVDPLALEEGRAAAARDALAKQLGVSSLVVGAKRPAPSTKTVSFQAGQNVAKRPAYQQQHQQYQLLPGESPATASAATAFGTPAPTQAQQQWTGPWPSQIPSGQRLTSLASPPPLTNTTPATAMNPVFLFPTATAAAAPAGTMLNGSQQQQQVAAAQAYLYQMKAAQILWNQQVMAAQRAQQQQQQQNTPAAAAGGVPNAVVGHGADAVLASVQQQQVVQVPAPVVAAPATTQV